MKRRLGWWALAGLLVGAFWALLSLAIAISLQPVLWRLAQITCPIALFGHFYAIKWYWAVVSNGVVYLLVGLVAEAILRLTHLRPASAS
jgi:hypothetical protein